MATKKAQTPADEKLDNQDINLFEVLAALDKKDYGYYDRLSDEQKKKIVPFILTQWMSAIKGNGGLSAYYLMNTEYSANKYLVNENVSKHPKLQWLMLCASSPGLGKQFHQWIPSIGLKVAKLEAPAKLKDIKEYYSKIYPKASPDDVLAVSEAFVQEHKKKCYLAETFPSMKQSDIEVLSQLITDNDIKQYEQDRGN